MNFGFTEEQELLRAEVRKFLNDNCPLEEVRKLSETADGYCPDQWKQIAELGWLGLTVSEENGGAGLGWVEAVVIFEETGRSLFPSPLISTTLAASAIGASGSAEQHVRWLPRIADGSAIGTVALLEESDTLGTAGVALRGEPDGDGFVLRGRKLFVHDAGAADLFVVSFRTGEAEDDVSLAVVERETAGVSARNVPGIDLSKRVGWLELDGVRVGPADMLGAPGAAAAGLVRIQDAGAVAVTAEMVGAAEAALALTAGYARQRIQFGQPIGTFQGVKHPLAEMYVDIESFKSLVYYASWALDESPDEVSRAAARAKAYASDAFARIGLDTVQLHGGIGYTWEYDAQLFLKRAKWARPAFGDADAHYERVAALGGL